MSVDLSQFIPTFLEESFEGIEVMEAGLLSMSGTDPEQINSIFRAAHSIKGGAGTFGFNQIAELTHLMETLLDEVRSGSREFTQMLRGLLLEAVDTLRTLLEAARAQEPVEHPIDEITHKLHQALAADTAPALEVGGPAAVTTAATVTAPVPQVAASDAVSTVKAETVSGHASETANTAVASGWQIEFIPDTSLLLTGNEPLLLFGALEELGDLEVTVNTDHLPALATLNPELVYLGWQIRLIASCDLSIVEEIFEWVESCSQITITALGGEPAAAVQVVDDQITVEEQTAPEPELESESTDAAMPAVQSSLPENTVVQENRIEEKNPAAPARKPLSDATSVRVDIAKLDNLMNRVGELVIIQSMLDEAGRALQEHKDPAVNQLFNGLAQLERNSRDLQEEVMQIRMLPVSFVFNRFPRMVHDISQQLGKKVELQLSGEQTELDKTVMEKMGDPLVHLVRNALDHGLETPDIRLAAGKPETGTLHLSACHQGGYIIIEISDDGRGLNTEVIRQKAVERGLISAEQNLLDSEIHELIFQPGFSTADQISGLSGRGVGMDVVRQNIEMLGGNVSVTTEEGFSTRFRVSLPLTLAILDGQLIQAGQETYVIPLVSVIESVQISLSDIALLAGEERLFRFRDEYIPLIHLDCFFGFETPGDRQEKRLMVVVEGGGNKAGLLIDGLQGQQQVVIKSLETHYKRIEGISGATILGNGDIALILDVVGLIKTGLDREIRRAVQQKNAALQQQEAGDE